MKTKNTLHTLLLVLFSIIFLHPSLVKADGFSPQLYGLVLFEVENDWAFDSEDTKSEVNTLFTTIEPYLILSLTDRLAIESSIVLEPLKIANDGNNRTFDFEALKIEELKLSYFGDNFTVFGGKFNPSFGIAWDLAKGIVGKDLAKDYELKERLGFGGSYFYDSEVTGLQTLTANTFFLDTSFLSNSIVTKREINDLDDGGVSNTEDLASFSVTLDGENTGGIKGLNTYISYYNQSEGDADSSSKDNEEGYAAAASYKFYPADKVSMTVFGEWANIQNYKGDTTTDHNYLTGSLVTKFNKNWNTTLAYTSRDINITKKDNKDDYQLQASAGYFFKNGFSTDIGYRQQEKSGKLTKGIVGLLAYTYEF